VVRPGAPSVGSGKHAWSATGASDLLAGFVVVDWGTGKVTDVGDAAAGDGAYCDGCDNSITTGLVYDVVLTPYGASKGRVAVLCEACFEDITSDMDVARAPGGEFPGLVEPWFL
jgi:hypothetical protein